MFYVSNPGNLPFSKTEAERVFIDAMTFLVAEYRLPHIPMPEFTLMLGEKSGVRWPRNGAIGAVMMEKWSERLFRQGVMMLGLNCLLEKSNIERLARECEKQYHS